MPLCNLQRYISKKFLIIENLLLTRNRILRERDALNYVCIISFFFFQISTEAPLGNLKEYVLDRRCQIGDIVMFLSQVAAALHYLHVNHIVHGDLRAEYVNVLASDKVRMRVR